MILPLLLARATLCIAEVELQTAYAVEVESFEGETWCSVRADGARLDAVLAELAIRSGLRLERFEAGPAPVLVTANLRHRPLSEVLEYLLGEVGLAADVLLGAIAIRELDPRTQDVHALHDAAVAAYLRFAMSFPEHELVPLCLLGQAQVDESRGNREEAVDLLISLFEHHRDSPLVPTALARAGALLESMEKWDEAELAFTSLLRLDQEHEFALPARMGLARAAVHLGDPRRALFSINALDQLFPSSEGKELQERLYLRARVYNGLERYRESLQVLDQADEHGLDEAAKLQSLELRATALERMGEAGDAARLWLAYGQAAPKDKQADALSSAARLALQAGDELGALFVCEQGARQGAAGQLTAYANEARLRLGMDGRWLGGTSDDQRLARAERLAEAGLLDEASDILVSLYAGRAGMEATATVRLAKAYGRCLERKDGVRAAISIVREVLTQMEDPECRRDLYLFAAHMLEEHELFDQAVEAYRGNL